MASLFRRVGFKLLSSSWFLASSFWVSSHTERTRDEPPIPERTAGEGGETLFTHQDILDGQRVFLRNGSMEYGSIFGHGAYLGPDFTADYFAARQPRNR